MKQKIRKFNALLTGLGLQHTKEDILSGYGVESTLELSEAQLDELIERLSKMQTDKTKTPEPIRRKRSVVLDLLTQMGIYNPESATRWKRVNEYLLNPRIAGKLMYEMNEEELDKLARKLRAIKIKLEKAIEEEKYWITNN